MNASFDLTENLHNCRASKEIIRTNSAVNPYKILEETVDYSRKTELICRPAYRVNC